MIATSCVMIYASMIRNRESCRYNYKTDQRQIYTSPYQPEFCHWAFAYPRTEDRFNSITPVADSKASNPIPSWPQVDIMLTHGPPAHILDKTSRNEDVGCDNLLRAVKRCRPRLHCFGHIHESWGAERTSWEQRKSERVQVDELRMVEEKSAYVDISKDGERPLEFGKETLFVNASIMNLRYQPMNAPWVVDLDLPLGDCSKSEEAG